MLRDLYMLFICMYKIAIPSYRREYLLHDKTLQMLKNGHIDPSIITIFVANEEEKTRYEKIIDKFLFGEIVVGKPGITNQRNFIKQYYDVGDYVVSLDDDLEYISKKTDKGDSLIKVENLDVFFTTNHTLLLETGMYLWGIYPVHNGFFMKAKMEMRTDLRFIIGLCHGFIVREDRLLLSPYAECKEDVEQSLLYYIKDGGVIRLEKYAAKTKFLSAGGLGKIKERLILAKNAAVYLMETYPDFIKVWFRKNGMAEVKLNDRRVRDILPLFKE